MIQAQIEKNLRHEFQLDDRNGLYLLFVSRDMLNTRKVFNPHWAREFGNSESRQAMCRWAAHRRDQWQAWGELAETIGRNAFWNHMEQMLAAEPLELVVGNIVHRCDKDERDIVLGEMLQSQKHGMRMEGLHRHRFANPAMRDRFYAWLHEDMELLSRCLVNMIYAEGTVAVSEALDGAVKEWKPKRGGRGRKSGGGKRGRLAATPLPTQVYVKVRAAA